MTTDPCPRRTAAPQHRRRAGDDTGVTLVELMVAMTLMSVVTLMFITGVMQIYRSTTVTESTSTAQSHINTVFQRLEREIRYASAIKSDPDAPEEMVYLTRAGGEQVCTQLWVNDDRLKRRTWTEKSDNPVAIGRTGWTVVASQVDNTTPFRVLPPDDSQPYQRLEVRLTATVAARETSIRRNTKVTFTALNTAPSTDADAACNKGRQL